MSAAERVRAWLDARKGMAGLDPNLIHQIASARSDYELVDLTVCDLETLVSIAENVQDAQAQANDQMRILAYLESINLSMAYLDSRFEAIRSLSDSAQLLEDCATKLSTLRDCIDEIDGETS